MSVQPQWVTAAGSLGTIPEGVFYSTPVQATAGDENVYFQVIAGKLPDGVQVTSSGVIQGIPRNIVNVQGVPRDVSMDVTSKFAIRAYTIKIVDGNILIDRFADRTFSITVAGENVPEFITPSGNVGTFYDGTEASVQIEFADRDLTDQLRMRVLSGELPPGLILDPKTGLISGVIPPLAGPPGSADPGYDDTPYSQYPFDFGIRSASKNFQFTLELTDGKLTTTRTFEIYVYAKSTMVADTTTITADDTFVTADVTPDHPPLLLTRDGDLGRVRADNWYFFKFEGIDFDNEPIEYSLSVGAGIGYDNDPYDTVAFDRGNLSLPPGLQLDPNTGWLYGYIPNQGASEFTYKFAVQVRQKIQPAAAWNPTIAYQAGNVVSYPDPATGKNYTALLDTVAGQSPLDSLYWEEQYVPRSRYHYFTITIIGNVDTEVIWLTDPDLGTIDNGAISTLYIAAENIGGKSLLYRLVEPGSRLPQGLTLQPSGNIVGRVSFNTFAIDGGTTTFDVNSRSRTITSPTTFDSTYNFTVNAYSPESSQIIYQVGSIVVTDQGGGYTGQPTITISAPPATENAEQATAGPATISGGKITSIDLGNPGKGYTQPPTITITGGGGVGAAAVCTIIESRVINAVSVFRTFTVRVNRAFNEPYESLYVKCMPPLADRAVIDQLIQNQDIIPYEFVYRLGDPNFGVAQNVTYDHAFGLTASTYSEYISSLYENHYWKNVVLGQIKTARALDSKGNVVYEVVYSEIIDDLVNNLGQSVDKQVTLPYTVTVDNEPISVVYPNSLDNMRTQVIDTVGQVSLALPLWMTSKQSDGRVLGFTPAWVITYTKPGKSAQIAYNIRERFGTQLNKIDFKIDRYELDRSQTHNWDPEDQQWIPHPAVATTFDHYSQFLYTGLYNQFNITGIPISESDFTGDGATTDFSITPLEYETLLVTINDVAQTNYTVSYAFRVQTIQLSVAPAIGDRIKIYQITGTYVLDPDSFPGRPTTFDGGATNFVAPADRWTNTDAYDKYLVFPRTNILN